MYELRLLKKVIHGTPEISQKVTALSVNPGDRSSSPELITSSRPALHTCAMAHVYVWWKKITNWKNNFLSIFWHLVW